MDEKTVHPSTGADARFRRTFPPRFLTVGRRTYRKKSRQDRRVWLKYAHPELRLSNGWLRKAGIEPGDRGVVTSPRDGFIVVSVFRRKGSAPGKPESSASAG